MLYSNIIVYVDLWSLVLFSISFVFIRFYAF